MGFLFSGAREEARSLSFQDVWGSGKDLDTPLGNAGVAHALRLSAVYSATSLIGDLLSISPMRAFREDARGVRLFLQQQPQLAVNPNPYGTRVGWVHQATASLLLRGNAYGYITAVDGAGRPSKIIWFHPDDVAVVEEQSDWFHWPTYYWRGRELDRSLVVHVAAYTFPGSVIGLSPLGLFRQQVQLGLDAQEFGADWFRNGATPSGVLKNQAKTLNPTEARAVKTRFISSVKDREPFVTGMDWDYKTIQVTADESQFLSTIEATATQIAAIYRVSPEDVGGKVATSLTYKTLEQEQTKLTTRTIGAWGAKIGAVLSDLLPRPQGILFNLDNLDRGDRSARYAYMGAALGSGQMTLDEARAEEGKPPLTPEEAQQWQDWYRNSIPATNVDANQGTTADAKERQ